MFVVGFVDDVVTFDDGSRWELLFYEAKFASRFIKEGWKHQPINRSRQLRFAFHHDHQIESIDNKRIILLMSLMMDFSIWPDPQQVTHIVNYHHHHHRFSRFITITHS
jgi:hypothetical protein